MTTSEHLSACVETELARIDHPRVAGHVRSLLVEPRPIQRAWDYGPPGQTYPCWAVLDHPASNTGIAYCDFGFGPRAPWGLVFLTGSRMSIGPDSSWFPSFLAAYFDSAAASEVPIWRVAKHRGDFSDVAFITAEDDWDDTWKQVEMLRASDPGGRYDIWQSIWSPP